MKVFLSIPNLGAVWRKDGGRLSEDAEEELIDIRVCDTGDV